MAASDFSILQRIRERGIQGIPRYMENDLLLFQQTYDPSKITTQYYQELLAFTLRELINTKVGDMLKEDEEEHQNGFAGLWLDNLVSKEDDFEVIYDLEVTRILEKDGHIHLSFTREMPH